MDEHKCRISIRELKMKLHRLRLEAQHLECMVANGADVKTAMIMFVTKFSREKFFVEENEISETVPPSTQRVMAKTK